MKCPFCGANETKVIDSRQADYNFSIRRRRLCETCHKRFTTYERVEAIPLMVIKKDKSREPYDRTKIEKGIFRACHKRPISVDQVTALIDNIENELFTRDTKEIPSNLIGQLVLSHLKDLDSVAYIRFASIYQEFKDVDTFVDVIMKLKNS
ncbi:MAG: transcriptional regulator NrdR [Lachnospiraceae bacterium]|jgi:transcriptional repressor NrdR|nr:transcriptional regulator NrdR [Lachnospiraceae bacterium]MEE3460464.1 transcriptional regulator NrdR [Lachnospiraceae bacterium]